MKEVLERLNKIVEVSLKIKNIYDELIKLEMNKDKDYLSKKNILLNKLVFLKSEETLEYNFFRQSYNYTMKALEYLADEAYNKELDETSSICLDRIVLRLKEILLESGYKEKNYEFIKAFDLDNDINYLISLGLSKEEAYKFYSKYIPVLNSTINYGYMDIINQYTTWYDDDELTLIKYYYTYTVSGSLENNLIKNNFNNIDYNDFINDEYITNYNPNIKNKFLDYLMFNKIMDLLDIFIKDEDLYMSNIILFATYIAYLSKKSLLIVKDNIENIKSMPVGFKDSLLGYINKVLDELDKEKGNSLY